MPEQETINRLRLARAEGVGPVTYRRLMERFGTAEAAIEALPRLARAGGRPGTATVPSAADAARELELAAKLGARFLLLGDADYPPLLAMLDDAPPAMVVSGNPALLTSRAVALVGGRNASVNGRRIAEDLGAELARAGLVVVSGMARGIDAAAHAGALSAGRTIAVVAGGLDCPYPSEHADLQRRIEANGAVVTEAAFGVVPQARHFPRRNRIIAGLVLGVVVVEAALRSGSLITARRAAEAGREVLAVPGCPLDPRSRGGNDLIREGAALVETAADVLANLPDHPADPQADRGRDSRGDRSGTHDTPLFAARAAPDGAPGCAGPSRLDTDALDTGPLDADSGDSTPDRATLHAQVFDLLGPSPTLVDAVVRRCQFSAPAVMAALLELELAGRVETLPGGRVATLPDPIA